MQIPAYADWRNRTVEAPSVILTQAQSRELLKLAATYARQQSLLIEPFALLRDQLQDDGWYRVEKHGEQILLMGVLYEGVCDVDTINRFTAHGNKTGNWSWTDWQLRQEGKAAPLLRVVR